MSEYRDEFVQESEERITELNNALLALERDPGDEDAMDEIFRIAHTLKSNCAAMGFEAASDLAHAIEDLLDAVRTGDVGVSPELMDVVFDAVDDLESMIDEVAVDGEVETDPSATVAALRDQLESAANAAIDPPTDDEIDAVLEGLEPPTDDDSAYLVRLAIDDDASHDPGGAVVDALVDAFDLLGTEPPREAVDAGEYDGRFDAVFASAVGEDAIASGLASVDEVDAFELTEVTDRFETLDDQAATGPMATDDADDLAADDAADLAVDELLDEVDEFDDLDELVEDVDDDELDPFEEMGDAGAFDDLLEDDDLETTPDEPVVDDPGGDGEADGTAESPSGEESAPDDEVDDASAVFDELKDEVETVGFDELEDELEDVEFGEFDDEEEVGFDELLGEEFDDDAEEPSPAAGEAVTDDEDVETDEDEPGDDAGTDDGPETDDDVIVAPSAPSLADDDAETESESASESEPVADTTLEADESVSVDTDRGADPALEPQNESDATGDADSVGDADPAGEPTDSEQTAPLGAAASGDEPVNGDDLDDEDDGGDAPAETADDDSATPLGAAAIRSDDDAAENEDDAADAAFDEPVEEPDVNEGSLEDAAFEDSGLGDDHFDDEALEPAFDESVPAIDDDPFAEPDDEWADAAVDADDPVGFDDEWTEHDDTFDDVVDEEWRDAGSFDDAAFDDDWGDEEALDPDDGATETDDEDALGPDDGATETDDEDALGPDDGDTLEADEPDDAFEFAGVDDDTDEPADTEGFDDLFEAAADESAATADAFGDTGDEGDDEPIAEDSVFDADDDPHGVADVADAFDLEPGDEDDVDPLVEDFGFDPAAEEDVTTEVERRIEEPSLEAPEIGIPEPTESDDDRGTDETQSIRVDVDQIDSLLTLVEGLVTSRVRLRHTADERDAGMGLERELDDLEELTRDLQETVMDIRLVPLKTVTNRLPRIVRDVARDQGKEVQFELTGDDVELDRSILDRIGDPLTHLIRNAVDHGLEPPEERTEAGKSAEGTVEVHADRASDRVTITVTDDGRGLDPDRLRSEAVDADVLTADEADELSDAESYDLVFHPGLTTAEEVTDVSGRGVGMDVVRRTVEDLDGTVSIDSEPGAGTTVTMSLPVSIAIDDVLFLECGGEEFGVPTKAVKDVESADLLETAEGPSAPSDDESDGIVRLDERLETPQSADNGGMIVRIREDVRPIALRCDDVRGQQEVVVTPFEGFMSDVPGISGATVRGRGEVVNILDVTTL